MKLSLKINADCSYSRRYKSFTGYIKLNRVPKSFKWPSDNPTRFAFGRSSVALKFLSLFSSNVT